MGITKDELITIIRSEAAEAAKTAIKEFSDNNNNNHIETLIKGLSRPNIDVTPRNDPYAEGKGAARLVRAIAAGKGDPDRAMKYAHQAWGLEDNDPVMKALSAGTGSAGGFLVPESFSTDIIGLLRPMSVVRKMGPIVLPMTTGSVTIPKQTGGATATYIGENNNIPTTEPTFGQLKLAWKKLAAIVPVSNDLLRMSSPNADTIIRDDLVQAMAQREDYAFIRDLGTEYTPKGLRYWANSSNVFAATQAGASATLAEVRSDLTKMRRLMRAANVKMVKLGWLMSPRTEGYLMDLADGNGNLVFQREMEETGKLRGIPYAVTTQIPENLGGGTNESELYLVDFNDAIIGESERLILEASTEAAYDVSGTLKSAFSLDQTVVRAIAEHDFGMRYDYSIVVLTTVKWGA